MYSRLVRFFVFTLWRCGMFCESVPVEPCLHEPVRQADAFDCVDEQRITVIVSRVQQGHCVSNLVVDDVTAYLSSVVYSDYELALTLYNVPRIPELHLHCNPICSEFG